MLSRAFPLAVLLFLENSEQMKAEQQEVEGQHGFCPEQEPHGDDILQPLLHEPQDLGS